MLFIRSLVFTILMLLTILLFSILIICTALTPSAWAKPLPRLWARCTLAELRLICGLDYRVEGVENMPEKAGISFWKHQSMWETMAQMIIFPGQCWVLKKSLMSVPFLGLALRFYQPIAIDRSIGRRAVDQVINQGRERLADNRWIMIFPEGTRMAPGTTRRYGMSGVLLAEETGTPITPVAHNAGDFWRRNGILKRPGTITVRIGKPIYSNGRPKNVVAAEVQNWIETQMKDISPDYEGTVITAAKRS